MRIVKYILLFLLALPSLVEAQSAGMRAALHNPKKYVDLPTPPSLPGATLLSTSFGSAVSQSELGTGVSWGIAPNPYAQRLRTQSLTTVPPYIFKSQYDSIYSVIGGATVSTDIFGQTGSPVTENMEYHHMIALGRTDASVTGATWTGSATGTRLKLSDIVYKDVSQGVRINGSGDAGHYQKIQVLFNRVFGRNTNHEAFYLGETSTTGYGIIDTLFVFHSFGYNKGWDGLQINSADSVWVSNVTIYDVGQSNTSGQNSLLQAQNIGDNALIENSLFWQGPRAFTISGRSYTIRNCIFYSTVEGLIQNILTEYATPLSTLGGTVRFENVHFYSSTPRTYAIDLRESGANFEFVNCTIGSNITSLYVDNRADKVTYSVTESGTVSAPTPTAPVFLSLDYTDWRKHARIDNPFFYYKGIGAFTPNYSSL
jgi:hypothetical protein